LVPCTACVDLEQLAQAADARGLDVDSAGGERRRADVVGASDRRVIGHALELVAEPLSSLGEVVRVLQIGVGKGRVNVVVQRTERLGILELEAVLALEVDRVDRARRRDLIDERRRPGRLRVELEAQAGRASERRRSGSIEGSLPRPSELTKRTGFGSSPSTSCSE
jgi:hypothetical protein